MEYVEITQLDSTTGNILAGVDQNTRRAYDFNTLKRSRSLFLPIPMVLSKEVKK